MLGFTYSQRAWPGAGDVDDCWVIAGLQAIHASAPWLRDVGVKPFREAAGKPDVPGVPNGGTEDDIAAGLRKLYPSIPVEVASGMPWDRFVAACKAGQPAALLGLSGALPAVYRFGFAGVHAVTVAWEGEWLLANPLAPPHSHPLPIEQHAIRDYSEGYKPNVHAVLMPTALQAFRNHPFLEDAMAHAIGVERARATAIAADATGRIRNGA